jgi:ribonucleoside-diphosphate reductase alpha chain
LKISYGPQTEAAQWLDAMKYRQPGETFEGKCARIADALKDNEKHFRSFYDILLQQKFLPAGRIQSAVGAAKRVTPYNCFVSSVIPDSMDGIMDVAKEAAKTMRLGGGIGYDFSTLRPRGDFIQSTGSSSSGPVSFMRIFDAICSTIAAAGHRRGAQMGVLRVDHPDIEEFIRAKHNKDHLTQFNVSVGITDEFMNCVRKDLPFTLKYGGKSYQTISARNLWNDIMRSTWDWAEPGVLFLDCLNGENNLRYLETITATNPCAEQPLPPNGACLLGSFNLTKYLIENHGFDFGAFRTDIFEVVRAMDNVIDVALYPTPEQELEAKNKRRMGLGVTGLANTLESLGHEYGSPEFIEGTEDILQTLAFAAYAASVQLAEEKGAFPLHKAGMAGWGDTALTRTLMKKHSLREKYEAHGIRNSHLLSIAPTGTISLVADNVSSGIEPVFMHEVERTIQTPDGPKTTLLKDYAFAHFGVKGKTTEQCTVEDHLKVLEVATKWVDSSVSKTINVGANVTFEEFKNVYDRVYDFGGKGCTTFRIDGKRNSIFAAVERQEVDGAACYYDPDTGTKSCDN